MKILSHWQLLLLISFFGTNCNGQNEVGSRDNPVQGPFGEQVTQFMGEPVVNVLLSSQQVEAYLLREWETDPSESGFHNAKVIDKKQLRDAETEQLLAILGSDSTYIFDNVGKRCEFSPRLGFLFKGEEEDVAVLIALNCDVLKIKYGSDPDRIEDCDPAHEAFDQLGRSIFPDNYEQAINPNPGTSSTPVSLTGPPDTASQVDTTQMTPPPDSLRTPSPNPNNSN